MNSTLKSGEYDIKAQFPDRSNEDLSSLGLGGLSIAGDKVFNGISGLSKSVVNVGKYTSHYIKTLLETTFN